MRIAAGVIAAASLALTAGPADADQRTITANGNPFTGGLGYDPADTKVAVADVVTWVNTDATVPHTATEDHGLWDMTGTYGPPGNMGFGPAEQRSRRFEAGTQHYFCKVHPTQMRGVIRVPVKTKVTKLGSGARELKVRWARSDSKGDRVFDAQLKLGDGEWRNLRKGTHEAFATRHVSTPTKLRYAVRARLRSKSDPSKATGWSPVVHVKV